MGDEHSHRARQPGPTARDAYLRRPRLVSAVHDGPGAVQLGARAGLVV